MKPQPLTAGAFQGFSPATLRFLEDLAAHQTRDWFLEHKAIYDVDVKGRMGALIDALAVAFAAHDVPLTGDAKRSLFRINRDVRFSKDKRPYKTNAGAVMSRDGTKSGAGILYIQVGGEDGAFMALGFYGPEPDDLARLRRAIAERPEAWLKTVSTLAGRDLLLSRGDALARTPKGFEAMADTPVAEDLKRRNFVVSRPIPHNRLFSTDLIDDVLAFAKVGQPLLEFGWSALARR